MIDFSALKPIPELSELCISLLKRFRNKQLTEAEFDREICYVSLKYGFEELSYMPNPNPPQTVLAYRMLDRKGREDMIAKHPWFFREGDAADYAETCSHIAHMNHRNKKHLEYMAEHLKDDLKAMEKINMKLYAHKDVYATV